MIATETSSSDYLFRIIDTVKEVSNGRFLFNQVYYLQHHPDLSLLSLEWYSKRASQTVALIHFFIHNEMVISPLRATFGGFEKLADFPPDFLDEFLQQIHSFLASRQFTYIQFTNHPEAYAPQASQQITAALLRQGYSIQHADLNYHIAITDNALEHRMHSSERRRLRKCMKAGFVFAEEKMPDFAEIHTFIAKARQRKGFPMSLTLEAFQGLFIRMPGTYRIFTVKHGKTLVALTVTVRINDQILYNFYPADDASFLSYSPTVLLTVELYNLARREGYTMLDLGIATVEGKPNYGLMRFKKNLGASESLRLTFARTLL